MPKTVWGVRDAFSLGVSLMPEPLIEPLMETDCIDCPDLCLQTEPMTISAINTISFNRINPISSINGSETNGH